MFHTVVVMCERGTRVVWRINEHAFDLACKLLLQCFEREEVVAKDQAVIKQVVVGDAVRRVIGYAGIFEQDARFEAETVFFTDPGEFQFLSIRHNSSASSISSV